MYYNFIIIIIVISNNEKITRRKINVPIYKTFFSLSLWTFPIFKPHHLFILNDLKCYIEVAHEVLQIIFEF
jgi:hypothetical protein